MKENVRVINVMADGSICDDLSTYITPERPLPEDAKRLIAEFVREGRMLGMVADRDAANR